MSLVDSTLSRAAYYTVTTQMRRQQVTWWLWFLGIMGVVGLFGLILLRNGPSPTSLAWLVYAAGALAIFYRPRYGLYLILFLGLAGDSTLMPWYPFVKNFSSRESMLFLHDALIISPLESYLLLTAVAWLLRDGMRRRLHFYAGEMLLPALIFFVFVIFGLAYGISTGGNANIALWESRAIFYLIAMLILTTNLLTKREHVSNLLWAAALGIFVQGLVGNWHFFIDLRGSLAGVNTISEHSAAMHMNSVFVLMLAAWLYRASPSKRLLLPLLALTLAVPYLAAQRRAAFLTLAIALALMAIILFREKRRAFWAIAPPAALLALVYIVIFWNSTGTLGLPAQAIKSIVAQDQANAEDVSSNIYREIENVNTGFTIRQKPLTGVGFGQKFYIVVPLPDISFFEWWEYLPHNSIIWIWLKTGVGGFVALLFLVGTAVMVGMRALVRMPRNDLSAVALTCVLYIIMHFIYAYADISWDAQSMIFVGAAMGVLNGLERIVAQPVAQPAPRWPWQPQPTPAPALRPLEETP